MSDWMERKSVGDMEVFVPLRLMKAVKAFLPEPRLWFILWNVPPLVKVPEHGGSKLSQS